MSNPKSPKATYTSLETDETPKAEAVAVASVGMPNIEAKQTVEVVAPADLSGGYQFSVDVNGRAMVVAVVSSNETVCCGYGVTVFRYQ